VAAAVVVVLQPQMVWAEVPVAAAMIMGQAVPELQGRAIREVQELILQVVVAVGVAAQVRLAPMAQVADLWLARREVQDYNLVFLALQNITQGAVDLGLMDLAQKAEMAELVAEAEVPLKQELS
jgi:hypothetical protein